VRFGTGRVVCLIDGPSLCVDYLLAQTSKRTVAELDSTIGGRKGWDPACPVFLRAFNAADIKAIYRSARVGLGLKRIAPTAESVRFLLKPYLFLTEPRRVRKWRIHLALALFLQGVDLEEIGRITGSPRTGLERYRQEFARARRIGDFDSFGGLQLGTRDLCRLYGGWSGRVQ
jgi:hypothetical protein